MPIYDLRQTIDAGALRSEEQNKKLQMLAMVFCFVALCLFGFVMWTEIAEGAEIQHRETK